jgi:hypothetical protein
MKGKEMVMEVEVTAITTWYITVTMAAFYIMIIPV